MLSLEETAGSGTPVVLLHELGGSANTFRHLSRHLEGQRLLALDLPGTGGSARITGPPSLPAMAQAVAETLHHRLACTPAVVVGVAGGAGVAAALAAEHPELVCAVVHVSLGATLAPDIVDYIHARVPVVRREGMGAVVDSSLARSFPEALRAGREEVYADYRAAFVASALDGYIDQQLALAMSAAELPGLLAAVSAPVVVVGGHLDELFPPASVDAAAAQVAHLVARIDLPGVAHLPHLQAPDALAASVALAVATRSAPRR